MYNVFMESNKNQNGGFGINKESDQGGSNTIVDEKTGKVVAAVKTVVAVTTKPYRMLGDIHNAMVKLGKMGAIDDKGEDDK